MWKKRCLACNRRGERGLTLIEVVVATAIFSVTVASLLVIRDRAIKHTSIAKNFRTARRLTVQLLEEIHSGKDYEAGASEAFDEENYPGYSWRIKEVETVEMKEPELPFLQDTQKKAGSGTAPGTTPGGGLLGGAVPPGMGEELRRYVVEVTFPARSEEGFQTIEVTTYFLKEGDPEALAKLLGGGGANASDGGAAGILGGGDRK